MTFVAQIDSIEHDSKTNPQRVYGLSKDQQYMFGDVGMIYVFFCFECCQTNAIFQCDKWGLALWRTAITSHRCPFHRLSTSAANRWSDYYSRPHRMVSHLLAYGVKVQPLGRLLSEALDGGEKLAEGLWHPLRVPVVHPQLEAVRLAKAIQEADHAAAGVPAREIVWFRLEIDRLIAVFRHAVEYGQAVVSVLDLPMDAERSAKIRIPFAVGSA